MSKSCSPLLAAVFAVALSPSLRAQAPGVSIPAWVEAGDCAADPAFVATVNGKPAAVTAQLGPASDEIILVVFDLTSDLSLIDAAKQAVTAEISKLPPNAWVGLLRAQDGLHVLADPGADHKRMAGVIQSLSNSGQPGFLETVSSALSLADGILRKSPVRVSVLYITDGGIYSYREDYTNPVINESDPHDLSRRFPGALIQEKISKLEEDTSSLEAPLFVVQLNYRHDRLNEAYQNGVETLAGSTGGKGVICRSVAEIPEMISGVFSRISNAWRLTLAVPSNMHNDAHIQLSAPCHDDDPRITWRTHIHPKEG